MIEDTVWFTLPVTQLVLRVKDEFEFEDEDRMKGDELDVWLGDVFPYKELFSETASDGASFRGKDKWGAPSIPFWILYTFICIEGDVQEDNVSRTIVLQPLAFPAGTSFIADEFILVRNDEVVVPRRSGDLIVLAFISSAASALEIFSCFFHLVRRFWNHILT